jgi:hypothetical protein
MNVFKESVYIPSPLLILAFFLSDDGGVVA